MGILRHVRYKTECWSYACFSALPSVVDLRDLDGIMEKVVELQHNESEIKDFSGDSCYARITKGKKTLLGTLFGRRYDLEIETYSGLSKTGVLLIEGASNPRMN